MSDKPFIQRGDFWVGIVGNLLASAIWWFGGEVLNPVTNALGSWRNFNPEWLHNLGWLACFLLLTNWFIFGERLRPPVTPLSRFQRAKNASKAVSKAAVKTLTRKDVVTVAGAVLGHLAAGRSQAQLSLGLTGEVEVSTIVAGNEILISIRNRSPARSPLHGISVLLHGIRGIPEGHRLPTSAFAWDDPLKPAKLQMCHGTEAVHVSGTQLYTFVQQVDALGGMSVAYYYDGALQRLPLPQGLWMAEIAIGWELKTHRHTVCFRLAAGGLPPVVQACPTQRVEES